MAKAPDPRYVWKPGDLSQVVGALTAAASFASPDECDGVSIQWDIQQPMWGKVFQTTGEHITGVSETTRKRVMKVIADSHANGDSIRDTAKAIQVAMKGEARDRATMIARTEMARLSNGASLAATQVFADATGSTYYKQWLTAPGAKYPRHEEYDGLDGQTVNLDDQFQVGEDQLDHPGDPDGDPGETINCRCTMAYTDDASELTASGAASRAAIPSSAGNEGGDDVKVRLPVVGEHEGEAVVASTAASEDVEVAATDTLAADEQPPNLRESDSATTSCATCQSYSKDAGADHGVCNAYSDYPVDDDDLCDAYKAQSTAAAASDVFADDMGSCSCGHDMAEHLGDESDGPCSIQGCDCTSYVPAEESAADAQVLRVIADVSGVHATVTAAVGDALSDAAERVRGFVPAEKATTAEVVNEGTGDDATIPDEHKPKDERPRRNDSPAPPAAQTAEGARFQPWTAVFAPEGKTTDDGRVFAPNGIEWRDVPLSLMAMTETADGHDGAEVSGRIDRIWRDDTSPLPYLIRAEGVFNDDDQGEKIVQLVKDGFLTGVSVDIAVREYVIGYRSDYVDENGVWKEDADTSKEGPSFWDLLLGEGDEDLLFVITEGVIGATTVCPFPAFEDATISLAAGGMVASGAVDFADVDENGMPTKLRVRLNGSFHLVEDALTASAAGLAPEKPPREWFSDPGLDELTPLTVTDDGRVYGHAWEWGTCHTAISGSCVTPPESSTDYALFHLKTVECEDGSTIEVGTITLDTNHAGLNLSREQAARHYDNTGTAVADVVFGDDEHGGWFSGALRPDIDARVAAKLRGSVLSGDWRRWKGHLELIALLACNVPGYPVVRAKALAAAAVVDDAEVMETLSLVAAGSEALAAHAALCSCRDDASVSDDAKARLRAMSARVSGGFAALAQLAKSEP